MVETREKAFNSKRCHPSSIELREVPGFRMTGIAPNSRPGSSEVKASSCNVGDQGLIPGLGRSSGEGNGNPLQHSCLENPMDRGAW